jgi:hypothetical protein
VSVFIGGSAAAMVRDIAEGYIIVSEYTFKKFGGGDFGPFLAELDKLSRELRGTAVPLTDFDQLQRKNRKLQRLSQTLMIVNNYRARFRR